MRIKTQRILAALLSLVLLLALAPAAWAVDLDTPNTVVVNLVSQTDYAADIVKADITADFYLIADAVPVAGYDTYSLSVKDAYKNLSVITTDDQGAATTATLEAELEKQVNAEPPQTPTFDEIVETLAKAVLENESSPTPVSCTIVVSADKDKITASGLQAGMYLMVPHGKVTAGTEITTKTGNTGYVKTITAGEGTAARTLYRSKAYSEDYEYVFKPQLVTVPGKEIRSGEGDAATVVPTYRTDEGTWTNTIPVNVKVEREPRNGDLKIVKTLSTYAGPEPAAFVFKIEWDDEVRYAEIAFPAAGTREYVLVKEIPVGKNVTVTEVNSGLKYSLKTSSGSPTQIVSADSPNAPATVYFTNDLTGPGGGSAVTNRFTYTGTDFTWQKLPDSGSTSGSSNTPANENNQTAGGD